MTECLYTQTVNGVPHSQMLTQKKALHFCKANINKSLHIQNYCISVFGKNLELEIGRPVDSSCDI